MTNQAMSSDIRRYALVGAQARLTEMAQEAEAIRRAFPELRDDQGTGRDGSKDDNTEASPTSRRQRSGTMSAAQRKAVGERMKKYWAARRAGTGATEASGSEPAAKPASTATGAAKRGPRTMSPEARKRISDAQKARWAKQREAKSTPAAKGRRAAKGRGQGASKRAGRKVSAAARKGASRRGTAAKQAAE